MDADDKGITKAYTDRKNYLLLKHTFDIDEYGDKEVHDVVLYEEEDAIRKHGLKPVMRSGNQYVKPNYLPLYQSSIYDDLIFYLALEMPQVKGIYHVRLYGHERIVANMSTAGNMDKAVKGIPSAFVFPPGRIVNKSDNVIVEAIEKAFEHSWGLIYYLTISTTPKELSQHTLGQMI